MNKIGGIILVKGGIKMSHEDKQKVIHADKVVIHTKDVEIIHNRKEITRRDPWGFFWGRQQVDKVNEQEVPNSEESQTRSNEKVIKINKTGKRKGPWFPSY